MVLLDEAREVGTTAAHDDDELTPWQLEEEPNTLLETPAAEDNPCVPLHEKLTEIWRSNGVSKIPRPASFRPA